MSRDDLQPRPLDFGDASPEPGVLRFADVKAAEPAPAVAPLFGERSARKTAPRGEPGRALFGESGHPLLDRCFELAMQRFPELYPKHQLRIERAIRQLTPPSVDAATSIADAPLRACGESVETLTRMTRDFADLDAAGIMAALLDRATHGPTLVNRIAGRYLGVDTAEPDYRAALTTLKVSLQSFSARIDAIQKTVMQAREGLGIGLAALCAVAGIDGNPDDATASNALHDRRAIVQQAFQQVELLSLQARGFEAEIVNLLSRTDQLMNVTLPAALAARQATKHTSR
ncbi:hypothetical protein QCE47_20650 [Caballeronia sp. LZ025]|uniref:hypothetical protein n=1 Tax=Caballeronia TaxID=1827195 RepID=UPI001FD33C3B|nr:MULTISPECIES: hypothetical protein [Caballeronia]MDR5734724.1 hypothetical protein [Caballeronia sp. LZ025]